MSEPGLAGLSGLLRVPDVVLFGGDLFEGAAGDGGVGLLVGDGLVFGAALEGVVLLDEQPVGLGGLLPARAAHAYEHPLALHLCAVEFELEFAVAQCRGHILKAGLGMPGSLVPDHDRAAAVLALGDDALKAAVLDWVVFDLHGEAAVFGVEAGAFGDRPALEHAVPAEAEVVVQVAGCVLLDDEGELRSAEFWIGFGGGS